MCLSSDRGWLHPERGATLPTGISELELRGSGNHAHHCKTMIPQVSLMYLWGQQNRVFERHHRNSRMVISNVDNKSHSQSEQRDQVIKEWAWDISTAAEMTKHTGLVFQVPTPPLPPLLNFLCFPQAPLALDALSLKGLKIQIKCFSFHFTHPNFHSLTESWAPKPGSAKSEAKPRDFPGGPVDKNPPANAGDMESNKDSTCPGATAEPVCHSYWSPRAQSLCSATRGATTRNPHDNNKGRPCSLQLEKSPRKATKTQRSQK